MGKFSSLVESLGLIIKSGKIEDEFDFMNAVVKTKKTIDAGFNSVNSEEVAEGIKNVYDKFKNDGNTKQINKQNESKNNYSKMKRINENESITAKEIILDLLSSYVNDGDTYFDEIIINEYVKSDNEEQEVNADGVDALMELEEMSANEVIGVVMKAISREELDFDIDAQEIRVFWVKAQKHVSDILDDVTGEVAQDEEDIDNDDDTDNEDFEDNIQNEEDVQDEYAAQNEYNLGQL